MDRFSLDPLIPHGNKVTPTISESRIATPFPMIIVHKYLFRNTLSEDRNVVVVVALLPGCLRKSLPAQVQRRSEASLARTPYNTCSTILCSHCEITRKTCKLLAISLPYTRARRSFTPGFTVRLYIYIFPRALRVCVRASALCRPV